MIILLIVNLACNPGGQAICDQRCAPQECDHSDCSCRGGDRLSTDDVKEMQGMQIIITHHSETAE